MTSPSPLAPAPVGAIDPFVKAFEAAWDLAADALDLLRDVDRTDPAAARKLADAALAMPRVGEEFLGFRLEAELGRGAFGRVFLARDLDLADRLVAVKVTADLSGEEQTLAQL